MTSMQNISYEEISAFLAPHITSDDWNSYIEQITTNNDVFQYSTQLTFCGMISNDANIEQLMDTLYGITEFGRKMLEPVFFREMITLMRSKFYTCPKGTHLDDLMRALAFPLSFYDPIIAFNSLHNLLIYNAQHHFIFNNHEHEEEDLHAMRIGIRTLIALLDLMTEVKGFGMKQVEDITFMLAARMMMDCVITEERDPHLTRDHFYCLLDRELDAHGPRLERPMCERDQIWYDKLSSWWNFIRIHAPHLVFTHFHIHFEMNELQEREMLELWNKNRILRKEATKIKKGLNSIIMKIMQKHAPDQLAPLVASFYPTVDTGIFRSDGLYYRGKLWMEYKYE